MEPQIISQQIQIFPQKCMNQELQVEEGKEERQQTLNRCSEGGSSRKERVRDNISIPLISKRMNSIEKYISDFDSKHDDFKGTEKGEPSHESKYLGGSAEREFLGHHRSVDIYDFLNTNEAQRVDHKNCVKYASIADHNTEERLERLSKLQKDYSLLKQKLSPHKKVFTGDPLSARKSPRSLAKQMPLDITEEDIQRELKTTMVNQNGKNYFADLYLLKKGRENIMSSLSNAGKFAIGPNTDSLSPNQLLGKQSYEEKVKGREKDFVSGKIIKEREVKKVKMMQGRNLHWNVYYDMLALSSSERHKLKGLCKFGSNFGIS